MGGVFVEGFVGGGKFLEVEMEMKVDGEVLMIMMK